MLIITLILVVIYVIFLIMWCYGGKKWLGFNSVSYSRKMKYRKITTIGRYGCHITSALIWINAIVQIVRM